MVKDALHDLDRKMKASLDHFRKELSRLRTGRANLGIFEDIKVDYYGVMTPVNQTARVGIPDPSLITVAPYDASVLEAIDKAIRSADLGFNPINDGKMLKIPVPPLDEERRREIVKKVKKMLAEHEGQVEVERQRSDEDLAPWWLFRATKPGVRIREILKEHGIETLREYQHRSRKQINAARDKGERI